MKQEKKQCKFCQGYGWWSFGLLSSIGEMDSREAGERIIKCPWCGAGYIDEGERWDALVESKKRVDEEEKARKKKKNHNH